MTVILPNDVIEHILSYGDPIVNEKYSFVVIQIEYLKDEFDYHQQSKFSSTPVRQFTPGDGFGGGDNAEFPTKNRSPETVALELPLQHFSESRNIGLSQDAILQTVPNTLN